VPNRFYGAGLPGVEAGSLGGVLIVLEGAAEAVRPDAGQASPVEAVRHRRRRDRAW